MVCAVLCSSYNVLNAFRKCPRMRHYLTIQRLTVDFVYWRRSLESVRLAFDSATVWHPPASDFPPRFTYPPRSLNLLLNDRLNHDLTCKIRLIKQSTADRLIGTAKLESLLSLLNLARPIKDVPSMFLDVSASDPPAAYIVLHCALQC